MGLMIFLKVLTLVKEIKMGGLFDENFYTTDFDKEMMDFIESTYKCGNLQWNYNGNELVYGSGIDYFWTNSFPVNSSITEYQEARELTKQQFKDKISMVDNNNPSESVTEPVVESDDELEVLSYQDIIDKCKTTNTNLVITGEGVYILDCINSVEYKVESDDDYEDIINAIELLQRKEVGYD